MTIKDAITIEATKLIRRHQRYASDLEDRLRRIERRSSVKPKKRIQSPSYWDVDDGFNPYHVRSHAAPIARAIELALRSKDYRPRPAVSFEVPKEGGGTRLVSVFQVADNAISRVVFHQLLAKNSSRLSAGCYAYRRDLTLHDAVLDIYSELRGKKRLFVAEFDFRKYFDSISHDHIKSIFRNRRFFVTESEQAIISAFLSAPTVAPGSYRAADAPPRDRGIPQGTSISLFIANIAAYPLDHRLERLGVGFARFADDTLIWSDNYSMICEAATALEDGAREMGVEINFSKSPGISILAPRDAASEFKSKSSVDFIGYGISTDRISIRQRSVIRIKKWISYLIYSNLLEAPKRQRFVRDRVAPKVDRDYIVMIFQIRRYLYGELSESQLRRFLARDTPRIHYHGLMSFYPIIDDEAQLRGLDGWMLHTIYTSLRKRAQLLRKAGIRELPAPHGRKKEDLLNFFGKSSAGDTIDLRIPSFARMSKALRRASSAFGANAVANRKTLYGAQSIPDRFEYRGTI